MAQITLAVSPTDLGQELNNVAGSRLETIKIWLHKNATKPNRAEFNIAVVLDDSDKAAFQAQFGGTEIAPV